MFNEKPELGYEPVLEESADGESQRTSVDQMVRRHKEGDLEAAWVRDLGVTWRVSDPPVHTDSSV